MLPEKRELRRAFEYEREKRQENGQKLCKYELYIMRVFSSPNIIVSTKLYCGTCNVGRGSGVEITKIFKSKNMKKCVNLADAGVKLCIEPLRTVRPIYRTGVPLPFKCCTLYIFSANISTEYFKHAAHSSFFSSKCRLFHNATFFGSCIIHILHTECAKI